MGSRIHFLRLSVIVLLLLSFLIPLYSLASEKATLLKVVDGDTITALFQGKEESVRLIGIDAPESSDNPKARKDAERSGEDIKVIISLGKKATAYVKSIVRSSERIRLEFDAQQRDKYGRLLAYVHLSDGRMLNEEVVRAGYASLLTIPPNIRYQDRFLKAYQEALNRRKGLWK